MSFDQNVIMILSGLVSLSVAIYFHVALREQKVLKLIQSEVDWVNNNITKD